MQYLLIIGKASFLIKQPIKDGNITFTSETIDSPEEFDSTKPPIKDYLTIDLPTLVYETNLESFKNIVSYSMLLNNSLVEFDLGIPCLASVLDSKMDFENEGFEDLQDAANCFGKKIGLKVDYFASFYRNFVGSNRKML